MNRRDFLATLAVSPAALAQAPAASTRYKIIGFTKPFQSLTAEQCADTVAKIGWDGIEAPIRPKGQVEPERAAEELPKLVEALKARGKELTVMTTGIKSASEPGAEALLRLAAKLGIKRYRIGFFKYTEQRPIPQQLSEIGAALRDLAQLNKEIGITGAIQNHSGRDYFGAPVWDIWSCIKEIDPRHLGVFFDIGHATIEGGLSWPIDSRLVASHFATVVVKDFVWERNPQGGARNKWVMLGEGNVNKAFFAWLKKTNYIGPICQHHEYDHGSGEAMIAKMRKDLEVLRGWLA